MLVLHRAGVLITSLAATTACGSASPSIPQASERAPARHGHQRDAYRSDHVHHDFSDVSRFAARFDDPSRDAWQRPEEVITLMSLEPGMSAADLGAGTGYFLSHLSAAVGPEGRVLALDSEPAMVRYMQRRILDEGIENAEAVAVGSEDPGLEGASIDRILIVNTWHHIPAREVYASRLAAALRPGGQIVVVDFTMESDLGPPPEARVLPERVIEELQAGGLRAHVVESEALPKQYVVVAER